MDPLDGRVDGPLCVCSTRNAREKKRPCRSRSAECAQKVRMKGEGQACTQGSTYPGEMSKGTSLSHFRHARQCDCVETCETEGVVKIRYPTRYVVYCPAALHIQVHASTVCLPPPSERLHSQRLPLFLLMFLSRYRCTQDNSTLKALRWTMAWNRKFKLGHVPHVRLNRLCTQSNRLGTQAYDVRKDTNQKCGAEGRTYVDNRAGLDTLLATPTEQRGRDDHVVRHSVLRRSL